MNITVTGASGLLGTHVRARIKAIRPVWAVDASFTPTSLKNTQGILHFAALNRGSEKDILETNRAITTQLLEGLAKSEKKPKFLIFTSSVHMGRNDAYGLSKAETHETLQKKCFEWDIRYTCLILPHVFGEAGKPFSNSVLSTFCYQLANKEPLTIKDDGALELLHAQSVATETINIIESETRGVVRLNGTATSVFKLADLLNKMNEIYRDGTIPPLNNSFECSLFNTLRSYRFPAHYPYYPKIQQDERGSLFESIRSHASGQSFISYTKPEITRGNHFHLNKIERFCVIEGEASISIRSIFSNQIHIFKVNGQKPAVIDIPTLHTHNIFNSGHSTLITSFWSHDFFDPYQTDTYKEIV